MKWHVSGADAASGVDRTITVDAPDEAQAAQSAKAQGLLVASITREGAKPAAVDYQPRGNASRERGLGLMPRGGVESEVRRRIGEGFRMFIQFLIAAPAAVLILFGIGEMNVGTEATAQLVNIDGALKLIAGLLLLIWLTLLFSRSKSGDK